MGGPTFYKLGEAPGTVPTLQRVFIGMRVVLMVWGGRKGERIAQDLNKLKAGKRTT
jgi:hypothetical protein